MSVFVILHTGVGIDVYMDVVTAAPACVDMDVGMDAYMVVGLAVAMHDDMADVIDDGMIVSMQGGVTGDSTLGVELGLRACGRLLTCMYSMV